MIHALSAFSEYGSWLRLITFEELVSAAMLFITFGYSYYTWQVTKIKRKTQLSNSLPELYPQMGMLKFIKSITSQSGPQFLHETCRRLGCYIIRVPGTEKLCMNNIYLVADPKIARACLTNPKNETKPRHMYGIFPTILEGDTFLSSSGHRALHVRKSTAAAFSSSNLNRIANTIDSILEKWIVTRLEPLFVQKNESLDMDTEMMLLTCEVICQVGFEYEMSSEEKLEMFNGLNIVLEANIRRRINPLKRTKLGLLFSDVRQARKISHRMIDLMKSILRNYRKRMQDPNDCVKKNTLAYRAINDSSYNSDDERVRDMLIFFFAGFETTAHSIAWTLLELGRNPTEQVKLREALHNWSKENGPDEDLRNCQAIKNATREGLRLHPSAPMGGFRILGEDLRISEGNVLPKGSSVGFPLFSIMRNHEIFDNPDLFCPDRWENPSKEVMEAFMPFVAGRRNCIGQSLAKSELTGVVSRLCSDYVIEIAVEGCSVNRMTMRPKGSRLKFRRLAKSDKN